MKLSIMAATIKVIYIVNNNKYIPLNLITYAVHGCVSMSAMFIGVLVNLFITFPNSFGHLTMTCFAKSHASFVKVVASSPTIHEVPPISQALSSNS